jgi:hypothetical protein
MWKLATNATDMPCSDFYLHIQKGVKEAIYEMDLNNREIN